MTSTSDDPLPDLIRGLRSRTPADRLRAAKDLGRLGWLARDAMPALTAATSDDDPRVREAAAQAVGQMGPDAVPTLSVLLTHQDKYVRRHAVWALGKLGPLAHAALGELGWALRDTDPRTASGAAQALGNMGADGAVAVPALAEAMRGTNIVLCRLAAKALSQIGQPALGTLIAHLQHADPFIRGESALALGWMGPVARPAVPFLARVVRGSRTAASLTQTPPPHGGLSLSSAATPPVLPPPDPASAEETCRVYAAQALGRIGPSAAGAVHDLEDAAQVGPELLRQTARQSIRQIQC